MRVRNASKEAINNIVSLDDRHVSCLEREIYIIRNLLDSKEMAPNLFGDLFMRFIGKGFLTKEAHMRGFF